MNTNPTILFPLIVSLFYLAIFFLVFGQKRRSHTRTSFLCCSGFYFAITFLEFASRLNISMPFVKLTTHLMLITFVATAASFLYFSYSITHKKFDKAFKGLIILHLLCIIYSIFPNTLIYKFNPSGGYYYTSPSKLTSLFLALTTILPALYSIYLIGYNFITTKDDRDKRILRIILVGVSLSVLYGIFIIVLIPYFLPQLTFIHRYSSFSTLLFLFATYYAINKYLFLTINYEEIETVSESLFSNLKEGVVIIGKFGGVVQSNNAAKKIFGEDVNIKTITHNLDNYSVDTLYANTNKVVKCSDGSIKHVKVTQTEIESGDLTQKFGKLLIMSDVSSEVKMKEEHEKLEEQVRHADKMRAIGQLAGGVAHDFNNQLTGIIGCADILHDEIKSNAYLHDITHDIIEASKRAGSLTDQLLAFARKGKYLSKEVDVHEIINETISFLARSIDKRIVLNKDFNALSSIVMGDPYQLHNAFLNIALNARDAMDGNAGEITFSTRNLANDNILEIKISDNGHGMSSEIKKKVFEPFFTTKEVGKGTGMGLAAVYGIIDNHNGNISFESTVGIGTIFSIKLYTLNRQKTNISNSLNSSNVSPQIKKGHSKGNILIIDDEEMVCKSTSIILESAGYKVKGISKPRLALEYLKENSLEIDIIILDLMMPDINGYQMFEKIKEISPKMNILLSSGYSLDVKTRNLLENGAYGFIQKPYTKKEILPHLQKVSK